MLPLVARREPGDALEADRLHVAPAREGIRFGVVPHIVAYVRMPAEELNRHVPARGADGGEDLLELVLHAQGHVPCHNNEIDFLVADGVVEPLLLQRLRHGLHKGVVGVAGKVEEEAHG